MPPDGPPVEVNPDNIPDGITFTMSRGAVAQKFDLKSMYRMRVKIASKVPVSCGVLHLWKCERPFEFEYSMTLFPKVAISGVVNQIRVTPTTDPSTRTAIYTQTTTPNGDGNNMQTWSTPAVSADPGYQITKIELTKTDNAWNKPGNPCVFVYVDSETMNPRNMGASAQMTGKNNSWPCTLHFTIWEEKKTNNSVTLPSFPVGFAPGETQPVKVVGDAASVFMSLISATGAKYIVPLVPLGGSAVSDPVVCTGRQDIGGGYFQYFCTAKKVDFY